MPISNSTTPEPPARWAPRCLDLMRLVRVLRAEYRACAELLALALERLCEAEQEKDRLRHRLHGVIDENRRLRQQIDATRGRAA